MANIARKQGASATSSSCAYGSANVGGNLLICAARAGFSGAAVVNDNNHNNWYQAVIYNAAGSGTNNGIVIWYSPNCNSGANTVSITNSSNQMCIAEYSGLKLTTAVLGPTNGNGDLTLTDLYSAGNVGPTGAALLIGAVQNNTSNNLTDTPSGGFSNYQNAQGNVFLDDQIISSGGTYTYGGELFFVGTPHNVAWNAAVAVFYPPTSGVPNSLMMMGCGT